MKCMDHYYSLEVIADRMMDRRQELRMTQKDLAKAINVETQTIGRYERGERIPSVDHMVRICLTLKVPFAYFIGIETEVLSGWAAYYEPFYELAGLPAREPSTPKRVRRSSSNATSALPTLPSESTIDPPSVVELTGFSLSKA